MKNGKLIGLCVIALLLGCIKKAEKTSLGPSTILVKGKITSLDKKNTLSNAFIYIYKDNRTNFKDNPFLISEPSNEKGEYSLTLLPGKYYFIARKFLDKTAKTSDLEMEPGEYFCYYGGNPITIYNGRTFFIGFNCSKINKKTTTESSANISEQGIKGVVTYDEKPIEGAYVYVFEKAASDFRGQVYKMSNPTDNNGNFNLYLNPGSYYVLSKKKRETNPARFFNVFQEGKEPTGNIVAGPLAMGDYVYYYSNNPVTITEGAYININLPVVEKLGEEDISDPDYLAPTRIEGQVKDTEGKPFSGIRVYAFRGRMMGAERPAYISNLTKEDGKFLINITEEGLYYLIGRDFIGRPPKAGDMVGYYLGSEDHSIFVKKDTVHKNIDLKVWKIE